MHDGIIGAGLGAFAAADTFVQIDIGTVVPEGNGILGADLLTGGSNAVLAVVADFILVGRTGMAGIGNDVDQRRGVILLRHCSLVHTLRHQMTGLNGTNIEAHS